MTTDPLRLPVLAHEVSVLADVIFRFAEGKTVDPALRRMLASRAVQTPFDGMKVHWGSLAPDPVAKSTYFIAVDGATPFLLRLGLSTSPGSGMFPDSILVGRMRTQRGLEIVVSAIPFGVSDMKRILTYAQQLDRTVLPGPQGVDTFFLVATTGADEAFLQFHAVKAKYGLTVAAWAGQPGEGLWGAIRNGWRGGFPLRGEGPLASRTLLNTDAGPAPALNDQIDFLRRSHGRTHDIDVRVGHGQSLTKASEIHRVLGELRAAGHAVRVVEVDVGLCPDFAYPSTVAEMSSWDEGIVSNVQWRAGGKPLVELRQRVEELQQAARQYGAIIGITGFSSLSDETLEAIGAGAGRRLWFTLGEGLPSSRILELVSILRG